jgi:hypothetical protein
MAKQIDYPRASLRAAIQLAEAVDGFAGSCSVELAAEKLGKRLSGAFSAQISSAVKYGLIDNKNGKLTICPLYRSLKLAYTPDEATKVLREALLSPPLFNAIYNRFKGQKLPIEHFEKMLIKEFGVADEMASRVAGYFLDGAKQSALMDGDNVLSGEDGKDKEDDLEDDGAALLAVVPAVAKHEDIQDHAAHDNKQRSMAGNAVAAEDFWLNIRGPGMNFSIEVKELDDLEIVQIMLRKIERTLKASDSSS